MGTNQDLERRAARKRRPLVCVATGVTVAAVMILSIGPVLSRASVGTGGATRAAAPVAGTFVGQVGHTGTFIAVVAGRASKPTAKRQLAGYICDGIHVSTWFFGRG